MKKIKTQRKGLYFTDAQVKDLERICVLLDTNSESYAVRQALRVFLAHLEKGIDPQSIEVEPATEQEEAQ